MMENKYNKVTTTTVDEDDDEECLRLLALKSLNNKKEFIVSTHQIKVVESNNFNKFNATEQYSLPQSEVDPRWANTAEYASYVASRSLKIPRVEVNCRIVPTNVQLSPRSLAFVAQNNDALYRRKIDKSPLYRYRSPSPADYISSPDRWSQSPSSVNNYDHNHKRHKRSKTKSPCTKRLLTPPLNNQRYSSRSPSTYNTSHYRSKRSRTPLSLSPNCRSDKKNSFKRDTSPHRRKPFVRNTGGGRSTSPNSKSPVVRNRSLSPKQENRKQLPHNSHKFQTNISSKSNESKTSRLSPVPRKSSHDDHSKRRRYHSTRVDDSGYKLSKNDKSKRKERIGDRNYGKDDGLSSRQRPDSHSWQAPSTGKLNLPTSQDNRTEEIDDNAISSSSTTEKNITTDGRKAVKLNTNNSSSQEQMKNVSKIDANESSGDKMSEDDDDEFEIDLFPSEESESENEGRFKLNVNKPNNNSATKQILSFRSLLDDTAATTTTKTSSDEKSTVEASAAKSISSRQGQSSGRSQYRDDHSKKRDTKSSRSEQSNSNKKSIYQRLGAARKTSSSFSRK